MSSYLKEDEYMPYAPDHPGRVRVNHTSSECSGGRSSMVVRRYEDGGVSAYCYRCGKKGSHTVAYSRTRKAVAKYATHPVVKQRFHVPSDATQDMNQWPVELRVWVLRSITEEDAKEYGIVYSESRSMLILPIDNDNFICRLYNKESKYISYLLNKEYIYNNIDKDILIIVEDYLSYIKLSKKYATLCLLGTTLKDSALLDVAGKHKEYVVFLDNDNTIVKQKQTAISKRLRMFGKVRVIKHTTDPKNCSYDELKELIGE